MISGARLTARAREAFDGSLRNLVPFRAGDETIGALRPDFAEALRRWPEFFAFESGYFSFKSGLRDPYERSTALAGVARSLAADGWITGWRDETYAVRGARGLLFHLERAAMRRFGLIARAAHANVISGSGAVQRMWIARRSASKAIDPGMLDNLVGGGIASGAGVFDTLVKEAREEAGIGPARAARARYVKALMVEREVPEGLHREILYVHDLEVAPGFRPRNLDGEVSAFERVDRAGLAARIARGEFTVDAGLVALDWLLRTPPGPPATPAWHRMERVITCSERLACSHNGNNPPGRRAPLLESASPPGDHSQ